MRTVGDTGMSAVRRRRKDGNIPILLAITDSDGHLSAWCPFCAKMHRHGSGEGHRVAHCADPESPYKKSGYVLRDVTKWLSKLLPTENVKPETVRKPQRQKPCGKRDCGKNETDCRC